MGLLYRSDSILSKHDDENDDNEEGLEKYTCTLTTTEHMERGEVSLSNALLWSIDTNEKWKIGRFFLEKYSCKFVDTNSALLTEDKKKLVLSMHFNVS